MKHRLLRVKELLKRELSEIVQKDYVFDEVLVTVNEVDVTPDLRQGHVYVSVIGPEHRHEAVLEKLNQNRGAIQHKMGQRVVLKYTPHLHFKLDDSIARGVRVMAIMDDLEAAEGAGEDLIDEESEGLDESNE
ncbi:MAG: 30S ribosome-binding factor RbfA [Verrucomicrobiota bacterium]